MLFEREFLGNLFHPQFFGLNRHPKKANPPIFRDFHEENAHKIEIDIDTRFASKLHKLACLQIYNNAKNSPDTLFGRCRLFFA